jgi:thiol-disulfide isomerase/thioredoxin
LAARIAEAHAKGIPEPPDSARFTSVRNPSEPFQFQFPDLDGKTVSTTDEQFQGKVVLVTIGGTWCPNCRDEAPFLVDLYRKYHARGLEIVTLSFEAAGDPVEDKPRIASFIKEFAIPYPVLLAGAIEEGPDKFPQLVGFGAYPTTIFLGRDGRVRARPRNSIHHRAPSHGNSKRGHPSPLISAAQSCRGATSEIHRPLKKRG